MWTAPRVELVAGTGQPAGRPVDVAGVLLRNERIGDLSDLPVGGGQVGLVSQRDRDDIEGAWPDREQGDRAEISGPDRHLDAGSEGRREDLHIRDSPVFRQGRKHDRRCRTYLRQIAVWLL